MRQTGLDILGERSWGSHICAFYEDQKDLLDLVVPYFKSGLENNEVCIWLLSEGLKFKDVKTVLGGTIKNIDGYIEKGQLKVICSGKLYCGEQLFLPDPVLYYWKEEEKKALNNGFAGIRMSQSGNWASGSEWQALSEYEEQLDRVIGIGNIMALCTYSLEVLGIPEILSMGIHHSVVISKKEKEQKAFTPISYSKIMEHFDFHLGEAEKMINKEHF